MHSGFLERSLRWQETSKLPNLTAKALLNSEVRIINVPRLQELSASHLIHEAYRDPIIMKYLPAYKENKIMNRQYLYNVKFQ